MRHTQDSTCNRPRCKLYEQTFASENQLHQHLRTECKYSRNNRIQSSKRDLSSESPQRPAAPRSAAASTPVSAPIPLQDLHTLPASKTSAALIATTSSHLLIEISHPTETSSPRSVIPIVPVTLPATPPPTYRVVSPPPPAYKATKAYLTIEDLYMRYAPLRALRSAR